MLVLTLVSLLPPSVLLWNLGSLLSVRVVLYCLWATKEMMISVEIC